VEKEKILNEKPLGQDTAVMCILSGESELCVFSCPRFEKCWGEEEKNEITA
jgi:hypothetical protein